MSLDAALERFAVTAPWYGGGLANHGPMAVEALDFLVAAGVDVDRDAMTGWADWYARRLPPVADAGRAFTRPLARIDAEIAGMGWEAVARRRVPPLLSDVVAGSAGHGLLRVAHAVRALQRDDTTVRRHELAHGLAYWTTSWRTFDAPRPELRGRSDVLAALEGVPLAEAAERGFFTDVLPRVVAAPAFAAAVAEHAPPSDIAVALSALTDAAARAFIAGGAAEPIALVHAVTVPAALRTLLPFLEPDDRAAAYAHAWQAVAAFVSGYGAGLAHTVAPSPRSWSDVIAAAVAGRDEHAIKIVAACAAEDAAGPAPSYAAAAAIAVDTLAAIAAAP